MAKNSGAAGVNMSDWKKSSIVSPCSAPPGKADPGPPVNLPPNEYPPDILNLLKPAQKEK